MSGIDARRAASRQEIVRALRHSGPVSRVALARQTGLSRPTVASIVAEMQAEGLVVEMTRAQAPNGHGVVRSGRPPSLVRLDRSAGTVVGIDIDRRHIRVAVADLAHTILAERLELTSFGDHADQFVGAADRLLGEVLSEAGVVRDEVLAVGMGLPGPVTADSGEIGSSSILPGWAGVRAHEVMTERLGLPVIVDNDANLGAVGEWIWGAGRGRANIAYLKISTGIGCGLILGGAPFRGAGGTAGELGHTIVDPGGAVCRCGNRGCLETVAGVAPLLDLLESALGPLTLSDVLTRSAAGDPACRRVIADAGRAIGAAAANLCNLVNPELIVVGGDLAPAGDLLVDPLRDALARAAIPSAAADVEVVAAELGDRAELLGAVALALRADDAALAPGFWRVAESA